MNLGNLSNIASNGLIRRIDGNLKNWSRTTEGVVDTAYFATNNSDAVNTNIYTREMEGIEFLLYFEAKAPKGKGKFNSREFRQCKEFFELRAKLWDELRREGAQFSKEKMLLLATLERIADSKEQKNRGIVELGRINAELGIITENAAKIFPEYARISKMIEREKFYERRNREEIRESEERNLQYYYERVQRHRNQKAAAAKKGSAVIAIAKIEPGRW